MQTSLSLGILLPSSLSLALSPILPHHCFSVSPPLGYLLYTPLLKLPPPATYKAENGSFETSQGCNPHHRKLVQGGVAVRWQAASAALTLAFFHRLSHRILRQVKS